MKTTRRSLLTMLGLGAAAAALAPVKAVEDAAHQSTLGGIVAHDLHIGPLTVDSAPDETRAFDSMVAYLVKRCVDRGCTLTVGPNHYRQVWSAVHSHPNEHVQSWLLDIDYVDIARDSGVQATRLAHWVGGCHADALKIVNERDDTAYLQGMIDQAAARGGNPILLTKRTYYISGAINVPSGVHLDGNGSTIAMLS